MKQIQLSVVIPNEDNVCGATAQAVLSALESEGCVVTEAKAVNMPSLWFGLVDSGTSGTSGTDKTHAMANVGGSHYATSKADPNQPVDDITSGEDYMRIAVDRDKGRGDGPIEDGAVVIGQVLLTRARLARDTLQAAYQADFLTLAQLRRVVMEQVDQLSEVIPELGVDDADEQREVEANDA